MANKGYQPFGSEWVKEMERFKKGELIELLQAKLQVAATHREGDIKFLEEMAENLKKGREGDPTRLDFLENMIDHWLHDLKST